MASEHANLVDEQMYNKNEYNRNRRKIEYADYKIRREKLVTFLGGCCFLCGALPGYYGLHLHHKEYHSVDSNYPRNSKTMSTRFKRLIEAENNPERFILLCPSCHSAFENIKMFVARNSLDKLLELLQ